jgi:N-acyl amino acid synthase of PEP-CTERM/exosortase system
MKESGMVNFAFKGYDCGQIPEEIQSAIFRLRYQVYCLEWGFEREQDHPGGLECDAYDPHAVHISARIGGALESDIIGTSRIILGSRIDPFPIVRHCSFFPDFVPPDRNTSGEISRLAVSKHYRRRAIDKMIFSHGEEPESTLKEICGSDDMDRRKSENEIVAGIYMQLYAESKRLGITHWYAVMARGLFLLLKRWGVIFHLIGPELDYHGWRGPYLAEIAEIEDCLDKKNSPLLAGAREVLAGLKE